MIHAEQGKSANALAALLMAAGVQTAVPSTGTVFLPGLGTTARFVIAAVDVTVYAFLDGPVAASLLARMVNTED